MKIGVTTTTENATGISLYLRRDDDYFHVSDTVGLRYGAGENIIDAMKMWAECVQDCVDEDPEKVAGAYGAECAAYRRAVSA